MVSITDLSDRCVSVLIDPTNFAGRQSNQSIAGLTVVQHGLLSRTPCHLSTAAGNDFNVMDDRSQRDGLQRESISNFGGCCFTGNDFRANSQTVRGKDVSLFTISVN